MKTTRKKKIIGFLKKNPEVIMAPAGILIASEVSEPFIIPSATAGIYGIVHGGIKVIQSKRLRKIL